MDSFLSRGSLDTGILFKSTDISQRTQQHLSHVYATLAMAVATCVGGVAIDLRFHFGGILSTIGMLMLAITLAIDQDKTNFQKRLTILAGYGFLQGLSMGPLMELALHVDPAIIVTALIGTVTIFVCFSLAAITSPRRSYFFLGGMISSALSFLCVLSLISLFWRPMFIYTFHLYAGLAIFSAYIIYDTQMIIEKSEAGSQDVVGHALELFIDLAAIFIRLVIILLRNSGKGKSGSNGKKSSSSSGSTSRR